MTPTIPEELILSALKLTGKKIYDMEETFGGTNRAGDYCYEEFYYPKFFYYLLSPEFIEKYVFNKKFTTEDIGPEIFGKAIYKYQKGNPEPLISLLSKIGTI